MNPTWYDVYRSDDGVRTRLGEACVWGTGHVTCDFDIPDVPERAEHKAGMPMNAELAWKQLASMLRTTAQLDKRDGATRPPWFTYWLEWERKATQTELELR